jgi:hypothetical protein
VGKISKGRLGQNLVPQRDKPAQGLANLSPSILSNLQNHGYQSEVDRHEVPMSAACLLTGRTLTDLKKDPRSDGVGKTTLKMIFAINSIMYLFANLPTGMKVESELFVLNRRFTMAV